MGETEIKQRQDGPRGGARALSRSSSPEKSRPGGMSVGGGVGESGAARCRCGESGAGREARPREERAGSARRMRAPGGAGPDLAAAPGPASKYLTFQAYLEGGEARKATFPPPPGPAGLAFPGVGGPERAAARGHQATPAPGEARTVCFPLPPGGRDTSDPGASVPILPMGTRRSVGSVCKASEPPHPPHTHPGRVRCPRVPAQRPAFPKPRGEAPASVSARSWPPHVFVLAGWESLFPTGFSVS